MNSRITQKFRMLRIKRQTAFMPFLVAGYPDFKRSLQIAKILSRRADLLEIGFPYSDSLADGRTIQSANEVAIKNGMNTDKAFKFVKNVRNSTKLPIIVLVCANLVYQKGINQFYRQARQSGIDGVLIPDLPVEESASYIAAARKNHIDPIFLISQTTAPDRLKTIIASASGFLYLVSSLGVTGVRRKLPREISLLVKRVQKQTKIPEAVGFGISTPRQVRLLQRMHVDGYIIGSALIEVVKNSTPEQYSKRLNYHIDKITRSSIQSS